MINLVNLLGKRLFIKKTFNLSKIILLKVTKTISLGFTTGF